MYVLYIDILFMINWIMNTLIFYCISLILNKRTKHSNTMIAGAIAALVYCMLIISPLLQKIPHTIYALVVPIPSLLFLYKPTHYKIFIKQYFVSMFIAAIFGGMVFNCWYMINGAQSRVSTISILVLVGIGVGICSGFYGAFYWLRRQFIFPSFEYKLKIQNKGKDVIVQSLLDTGNLLYTPIKHEPVLVVEYDVMKPLLSVQQKREYEAFCCASELEIEERVLSGIYGVNQLIPFNSVGCKSGFLWSIQVDDILIQKYTKQVLVHPCIIGLSSEKLFSDGQFKALLHPELIIEEVKAS